MNAVNGGTNTTAVIGIKNYFSEKAIIFKDPF